MRASPPLLTQSALAFVHAITRFLIRSDTPPPQLRATETEGEYSRALIRSNSGSGTKYPSWFYELQADTYISTKNGLKLGVKVSVCVFMCACVRARVSACVPVCLRVCMCASFRLAAKVPDPRPLGPPPHPRTLHSTMSSSTKRFYTRTKLTTGSLVMRSV